jgi:hypothetical protein
MKAIRDVAIIGLMLAILYMLWRLLQQDSQRNEPDGGASPEFVSRINRRTEDAQKRLNEKQQANQAANRLGR